MARFGIWLTAKLAKDDDRERALANAEVYAIAVKFFIRFNHPRAQLFKFASSYSNIKHLSEAMLHASMQLEKQVRYIPARFVSPAAAISMEAFFIDSLGRYLTPEIAVAEFKDKALGFLKLYYEIEKVDYGTAAFNRRVLRGLVNECINTAGALRKYSYEE